MAAARLIVVVAALIGWALAGCSAVELYQQSATAGAEAAENATTATEDATRFALEAAHDAAQATLQALEQEAKRAAATIAAMAATPTSAPAAANSLPLPASAETVVYGSVPIDSDRLNIIAALAFDADGRLLAATRAGEIYAMPDGDGDGLADETRLIFADEEEQLGQVSGLIARGWALIALNGERLSLLRDGDGDGVYDGVRHLNEGLPADQSPLQASNSLAQAPDGRLFTVDINSGEILRIVLRE
ncbi:MAG: hypothetical protein OXG84_02815 [Chloroflexi bacterium]|nr:hypothetical protein [Chloroflexota bacterium]